MPTRWFSRGLSHKVLHEQYAKLGRIDMQAPIVSSSEIVIDASPERAWRQLINLAEWSSFAPTIQHVKLESDISVDAHFRFQLNYFPIRARFAVIEPNRELTWTGRSLWFTAIDRHVLEALDGNTVRLSISESFSGVFAVPLMSAARLKRQHEVWLQSFKSAVERH